MVTRDEDGEDVGLTRLLRATRADADPALWTRVRARIASRRRVPVLLDWAMRPAALAASLGLFLASAGLTLMLASGASDSSGDDYATLGEALVAERDSEAAPAPPAAEPRGAAASDTGGGP